MTTNAGKYREVAALLAGHGIEVEHFELLLPEVQADTMEDVVAYSMKVLAEEAEFDFLVDDSGFFVDALKGFPGVYSSYVFRTIGLAGILSLLEVVDKRQARFQTVMGLRIDGETQMFRGECRGTVTREPRGTGGFGFDPIFVPDGHERTFAEMTVEEKNAMSHRGSAAKQLADFLKGR
ncbi:MAG TPA: XTP/dITP diphosphatase [Thermoplasmata archaeon]|nr:XTP/dITP diphosphatase [Thermoplasmata archaeon]